MAEFSTLTMERIHHFYLAAPKHLSHPQSRPPPSQALPIAPPAPRPLAPSRLPSVSGSRLFWTFLRDGITRRVSPRGASLTERRVSEARRPRSCVSASPLCVAEPRSALRLGLVSLPVRRSAGDRGRFARRLLLHRRLTEDSPPAPRSAQRTWGRPRGALSRSSPRHCAFKIRGSVPPPAQGALAGAQVPRRLAAAPARVVPAPTPEALLWPRPSWGPLIPVGAGRVGRPWAARPGTAPTGTPLPQDSRGTGARQRRRQLSLQVQKSRPRSWGALGAPPSPVAPSRHLSARATHRHGAFAEVTPRGQCHQPGTPRALRAGGLDAARCPQPRAAGWAGGTGANSKRDDPQGPGPGAEAVQAPVLGSPVAEPARRGRNEAEGPDAWGPTRDPTVEPRVLRETLVSPWAWGPFSLQWRRLDRVCCRPRPSGVSRRFCCVSRASSETLLFL